MNPFGLLALYVIAGLSGLYLHEIIHYIAAKLAGANNVEIRRHGALLSLTTYYELPLKKQYRIRAINLSPHITSLVLAWILPLTAIHHGYNTIAVHVAVLFFCIALVGLKSHLDFQHKPRLIEHIPACKLHDAIR